MREHINAFHNNNIRADASGPSWTVCPHCTAVVRNVPHAKDACFFNPKSSKNITMWSKDIMKAKGVVFEEGE